jgi:hypothetical protein
MMIQRPFARADLFALILAALPVMAQNRASLPAAKIEKIEQAISSAMSRQNIPACRHQL